MKESELAEWQLIAEGIFLPVDEKRNLFLQQENFLDKEIRPATSLLPNEVPLHQHWSWDRILRSCFIKQADVLQGLYFFEEQFERETIKRNFEFYEPLTVHESSLSPCVHSILASVIGDDQKAYDMYLRTARLDLDDYNNDTEDGCHITSMAGTWLSIVHGFAGMRIMDDQLTFQPTCPDAWESYRFRLVFRGRILGIKISQAEVQISMVEGVPLRIKIGSEPIHLSSAEIKTCPL